MEISPEQLLTHRLTWVRQLGRCLIENPPSLPVQVFLNPGIASDVLTLEGGGETYHMAKFHENHYTLGYGNRITDIEANGDNLGRILFCISQGYSITEHFK